MYCLLCVVCCVGVRCLLFVAYGLSVFCCVVCVVGCVLRDVSCVLRDLCCFVFVCRWFFVVCCL